MDGNSAKTAVASPTAGGRECPAHNPKSGKPAACMACRRSPVRARLAPSDEAASGRPPLYLRDSERCLADRIGPCRGGVRYGLVPAARWIGLAAVAPASGVEGARLLEQISRALRGRARDGRLAAARGPGPGRSARRRARSGLAQLAAEGRRARTVSSPPRADGPATVSSPPSPRRARPAAPRCRSPGGGRRPTAPRGGRSRACRA
jgi:hypothetical protein